MNKTRKTLKLNDISTNPVKLKYAFTCSRSDDAYVQNGITVFFFPNAPEISLDITQNIKKEDIFYPKMPANYDQYVGIRHRQLKNLYYQNYITGSVANSSSYWDWNPQSTACSGSPEYENRNIIIDEPQSYAGNTAARLSYIYIPPTRGGEQISRGTFCLKPHSGNAYKVIDDGNGNLIDIVNNNVHVGNIIYSQGMILITNQDYYQTFITP